MVAAGRSKKGRSVPEGPGERPAGAGRESMADVLFGRGRRRWLLILLLFVAAWLRFSELDRQSLWLDELITHHVSDHPTAADVVRETRARSVHPPLFYLIEWAVIRQAGDSETAMRMPSAVAGVLSVWVVYLLGRRLYNSTVGLIAAALTAVLWCPVYYSQEARFYAMLILFTMLSICFWIPVVQRLCRRERPGVWSIAGYMVFAFVTAWVHYFGLLIVALQGLAACVVLLVKRPKALLILPVFYVPTVLAYLWWLPQMLRRAANRTIFHVPDPPAHLIVTWLRWVFNDSWVVAGAVFALYAWLLGVTVYRAFRKRKTDADAGSGTPHAGWVLFLWLIVPFIVLHVMALTWRSMYKPRCLLICFPAACLLVARGIERIPVRAMVHGAITVAVSLALIGHLLFGMRYYVEPTKDQFREAVGYVAKNDRKYPRALITTWTCDPASFNYYFARFGSPRRVNWWSGRKGARYRVAEVARSARADYIWVVSGRWKIRKDFLGYMDARCTPVLKQDFVGAQVLLYRNERPHE